MSTQGREMELRKLADEMELCAEVGVMVGSTRVKDFAKKLRALAAPSQDGETPRDDKGAEFSTAQYRAPENTP